MRIYIVIPAHNEEAHLKQTLQSLTEQSILPNKLVIVNDNSSDGTQTIIDSFSEQFDFIKSVSAISKEENIPGSKVIEAVYQGIDTLDDNYDIICKFDADLIFPKHYLEQIIAHFKEDPEIGMAAGFCYVEENGDWVLENLTNKEHIRGALKAYRKECFKKIGGVKKSIGWDTMDELLAQYHGWKIKTDPSLIVKHLKPTGTSYSKASKYKQGEAFYTMRYGFWLTVLASAKLAQKKSSVHFFLNSIRGYCNSQRNKAPFSVSEEEGVFIRKMRWEGIKKKLL